MDYKKLNQDRKTFGNLIDALLMVKLEYRKN